MLLRKLLDILGPIVRAIVGVVTPELRTAMQEWIKEFSEKARKTPNPFDDIFAEFLADVLGLDI